MRTAIFWVRPPYAPQLVCGELNDGLDWLFGRCEQHGVRVDGGKRAEARQRLETVRVKPAAAAARR